MEGEGEGALELRLFEVGEVWKLGAVCGEFGVRSGCGQGRGTASYVQYSIRRTFVVYSTRRLPAQAEEASWRAWVYKASN